MFSNCSGCNDILPHTKKAKLCESCRDADKDKKRRKKWLTDKDLANQYGGKWVGGEKKAKIENDDEVTCYACNGKFSSEEKCRDHCCQNIKDLVCEIIDLIGEDYDIGQKTLKEAVSCWMDKNSE